MVVSLSRSPAGRWVGRSCGAAAAVAALTGCGAGSSADLPAASTAPSGAVAEQALSSVSPSEVAVRSTVAATVAGATPAAAPTASASSQSRPRTVGASTPAGGRRTTGVTVEPSPTAVLVAAGPGPTITSFTGRAHCGPGQKVGEATLTWSSEHGEQAWLLYLGGSAPAAVPDPLARPGATGPLAPSGTASVAVDCTHPSAVFVLGAYQVGTYQSSRSASRVLTVALR